MQCVFLFSWVVMQQQQQQQQKKKKKKRRQQNESILNLQEITLKTSTELDISY